MFLLVNLTYSQQSEYKNFVDKPYVKPELPKMKDLTYLLQIDRKDISSTEFICYTEQELAEIKLYDINRYNYYAKAFAYYNNLPEYVKTHFTTQELWYIYENDTALKNKLLNYKN